MPDNNDSRPPYQVIADRLRERVASGEFAAGDQLPAVRELAAAYDVAPNTLSSAIKELVKEGLLISQQGRGTFVRDGAAEQLQADASPEFRMLSDKLDAIAGALESLAARVQELEATAHAAGDSLAPADGRPAETTSET